MPVIRLSSFSPFKQRKCPECGKYYSDACECGYIPYPTLETQPPIIREGAVSIYTEDLESRIIREGAVSIYGVASKIPDNLSITNRSVGILSGSVSWSGVNLKRFLINLVFSCGVYKLFICRSRFQLRFHRFFKILLKLLNIFLGRLIQKSGVKSVNVKTC